MRHNVHSINVYKHLILHVTDSPIFGQKGLVAKPKPFALLFSRAITKGVTTTRSSQKANIIFRKTSWSLNSDNLILHTCCSFSLSYTSFL